MGAGFDNAGQHLFLQDCFGDATPCSGAPMDDDEMKRLSKLKTGVRKKKKKKLSFDKLGRIQYKLKAASYTAGGMDWHNLFKQYDKDFSGTLEVDELQKAVRSTLKLSPQDMPDSDIEGLFGMLDLDDSETIEIDEFLIFLEQGPEAVLNPQGADAAAARQLAAEGEEGSEKKPSRGSRGSIDESPANDDEDGTRSRAMTASSAVSSSSQPVVQLQHTGPPIHRAVRDQNNRIMMNCGAGQMRQNELALPFVAIHTRQTKIDNKKRDIDIHEKRVFGLAKQTAAGLSKIGIKYEMTSIANIIQLAHKYKDVPHDTIITLPNHTEVEQALEVTRAIRAFKMHKVARALHLTPNSDVTWGNDSPLTLPQKTTGHLGLLPSGTQFTATARAIR